MDEDTGLSASPRDETSGETRRKRKVLSCHDCRRRKLRCDRRYPSCSRCQKAGKAASCSYDERSVLTAQTDTNNPISPQHNKAADHIPLEWSSLNPGSRALQLARLGERHDMRNAPLEAHQTSGTWQHLGAVSPGTRPVDQRPAVMVDNKDVLASPYEILRTETVIFRGGNFKTQYYGGSNPTSIIAHFPELRSFMKEAIMHNSSLARVQRDLKSLQVRWKVDKRSMLPLTDPELLHFLPDREVMDYLIRLYFDTSECMYRILHRPSFWKEYGIFWENPEAANPGFVVLILLIMAVVSCISPQEKPAYIGDSALARERAVLWIEVSEWWLGRQSRKHTYLAIWQIRSLLVLAKQVNVVKKKEIWTAAGNLVREAMSAGFHRDPGFLGEKVSIFDQEMRRRLWATMIELELQASIDRGMPSASAGIPSDCAPVLNANDEDLSVECDDQPVSKPWSEYTETSFLHISRSSFSLRVSLNSLANDLSSPLLYEEVLNYEERIMQEVQKLPSPTGSEDNQDSQEYPTMARSLLDIQLRQFLILLHAPFARQADTNSRYLVSRMICFNAAAKIIEQYSKLARSGSFLLLLLRHDYFRGALIICHHLHVSIAIHNDIFFNSNSNAFIKNVEDALDLLEDRITRLGTGYTHYWYISSALSLVQSAITPNKSTAQKQQAVDRVARQYQRILDLQEDFIKAKEKLYPGHNTKTNTANYQLQVSNGTTNGPGVSFLDASIPQTAFTEEELPPDEFYFGDPAAWIFDNLWTIE